MVGKRGESMRWEKMAPTCSPARTLLIYAKDSLKSIITPRINVSILFQPQFQKAFLIHSYVESTQSLT